MNRLLPLRFTRLSFTWSINAEVGFPDFVSRIALDPCSFMKLVTNACKSGTSGLTFSSPRSEATSDLDMLLYETLSHVSGSNTARVNCKLNKVRKSRMSDIVIAPCLVDTNSCTAELLFGNVTLGYN